MRVVVPGDLPNGEAVTVVPHTDKLMAYGALRLVEATRFRAGHDAILASRLGRHLVTKNNLEARIAGWLLSEQSKPTPKTKHHKPGSQKK